MFYTGFYIRRGPGEGAAGCAPPLPGPGRGRAGPAAGVLGAGQQSGGGVPGPEGRSPQPCQAGPGPGRGGVGSGRLSVTLALPDGSGRWSPAAGGNVLQGEEVSFGPVTASPVGRRGAGDLFKLVAGKVLEENPSERCAWGCCLPGCRVSVLQGCRAKLEAVRGGGGGLSYASASDKGIRGGKNDLIIHSLLASAPDG